MAALPPHAPRSSGDDTPHRTPHHRLRAVEDGVRSRRAAAHRRRRERPSGRRASRRRLLHRRPTRLRRQTTRRHVPRHPAHPDLDRPHRSPGLGGPPRTIILQPPAPTGEADGQRRGGGRSGFTSSAIDTWGVQWCNSSRDSTRRSSTWSRRPTTATSAACRSSAPPRRRTGARRRRRPPTRSTSTAWRRTPGAGSWRCRSASTTRTGSRIRPSTASSTSASSPCRPRHRPPARAGRVAHRVATARPVAAAVGGVPHRGRRRGSQVRRLLQDPPLRDRRRVRHPAGAGDDAADARAGQPPDAGDAVASRARPVAGRDAGPRAGRDGAAAR